MFQNCVATYPTREKASSVAGPRTILGKTPNASIFLFLFWSSPLAGALSGCRLRVTEIF